MQNISLENIIKTILIENNYAVVPGFGAFITNYQSAYIDTSKEVIYPPNRVVSFNSQIIADDGVLVNYLYKIYSIDYKSSKDIIDKWVKKLFVALAEGKSIVIDKVGEIRYNLDLKMEFFPQDNREIDVNSYGMTTIPCQMLAQKPNDIKINRFLNRKIWYRAAVFIPLILFAFALSYYFVDNSLYNNLPQNLTSFFTYKIGNSDNQISESHLIKEELLKDNEFEDILIVQKNEGNSLSIQDNENNNNSNCVKDIAHTVAESRFHQKKVDIEKPFWLIAGCFSRISNAKQLVKKLSDVDKEAFIVPYNDMYRVVVEKYITKQEAVVSLRNLRDKHNISTWIYTKR